MAEDGSGPGPDFEAAALYVTMAREAHEAGDRTKRDAAIKLVAVSLGIEGVEIPRFHLKHLART